MKKKIFLLLCGLIFLFLSISTQAQELKKLDVPYVPTPYKVVDEMLRLAEVGKNDLLYDLGCGDGRIVITAAQKYGTRGVGIDIDPERLQESNENAVQAGVTGLVKFLEQDLFEADIHQATVVTLYLLTSVNLKLRPKLLHVLRPGTRIVSHDFSMEEWQPDKTTTVFDDEDSHKVFFWVVPANVTGTWEWTMAAGAGKKNYLLKLEQLFQWVNGTLSSGKSQIPIMDAKLNGDRLQFKAEEEVKGGKVVLLFDGRVIGNLIDGTVEAQNEPKPVKRSWKATRDPATIKPLDSPKE